VETLPAKPLKGAVSKINTRTIHRQPVRGPALAFMQALGFECTHEYVRRGWAFHDLSGVRITVTQVAQVFEGRVTLCHGPSREDDKVDDEGMALDDRVTLVPLSSPPDSVAPLGPFHSQDWLVEVSCISPPLDAALVALQEQDKITRIAAHLRGFVDLVPLEHRVFG
jgi:hypothetical protein